MKICTKALRNFLTTFASTQNSWFTDLYHFHLVTGQDIYLAGGDASVQLPYRDKVVELGPALYWNLGDADQATVADEVNIKGKYDGTTVNTPTVTTGLIESVFGEQAAVFDRTAESYVAFQGIHSYHDLRNADTWSFSFWAKFASVGGPGEFHNVLYYGTENAPTGEVLQVLRVFIKDGERLWVQVMSDFGTALILAQVPEIDLTETHHYAIVFNLNDGLWVYIDGKQVSFATPSEDWVRTAKATIAGAREQPLSISIGTTVTTGSPNEGSFVTMQDFAYFTSPLSADDVAELHIGGVTPPIYTAKGFRIDREGMRQEIGLSVDDLELKLSIADDDELLISDGVFIPLIEAIQNGAFSKAEITLSRAFAASVPVYAGVGQGGDFIQSYLPTQYVTRPLGVLNMFRGNVDSFDSNGLVVNLKVASVVRYLDIELPRHTYKPGCTWSLYSRGCTIKREFPYRFDSLVKEGSTKLNVVGITELQNYQLADGRYVVFALDVDDVTRAKVVTGFYDLGQLVFVTGKNAFIRRPIKAHYGASYTLFHVLPYDPEPGDSFYVLAGCDKTSDTCAAKFGNIANHRGFPYVPVKETKTGIPLKIYAQREGHLA